MRYIYTAMKHSPFRALLLIVGMMFALDAFAWHEYQPMVVEGRRWECGSYHDLVYVIEGDTVVNGDVFKKLYEYFYDFRDPEKPPVRRYYAALREVDRKVYVLWKKVIYPHEEVLELLCDFSLGVINRDASHLSQQFLDNKTVGHAINVVIEGQERRVLNIVGYRGACYPAVEGIGNIDCAFCDPDLFRCTDGDKVLYDYKNKDYFYVYYPDDMPFAVTDGEVNGDNCVDIGDVNSVINMMMGKPLGERCDDVAADMNLDVKIDAADVNAIINVMLGKKEATE